MERLTYRSTFGNAVSKGACSGVSCDFDCDACPIDTIIQHLCYYEDMIENGKLVEQKHGRWIPIIDEPTPLRNFAMISGYECSICGRYENEEEPYCNCGVRMEDKT